MKSKKITGWSNLQLFYSAETTQYFLEIIYKEQQVEKSREYSYKNGDRFIFYLKHAEAFFTQAAVSSIEIKPILLFYGTAQLLKACLLTVDYLYPSHTSVLAHGVTTRKRKKQNYRFYEDEVKIQKNGLCMHVCRKLFGLDRSLEDERFQMKQLITRIPELNEVLSFQRKNNFSLAEIIKTEEKYAVPIKLAQDYCMSVDRLAEYIAHHLGWKFIDKTESYLYFVLSEKETCTSTSKTLLYNFETNQQFLPAERDRFLNLPELISHYLLLYNLSMIARYETEWWYELILQNGSDDYVIIQQFLEIAEKKVPIHIADYLTQIKQRL
ncbi:YaaC family protein [Bacillus gobiensis]|uniref:YaaC family protein n=1 Tax=Bacillus gobiensis TaxID=1441095 RepID=UPI003D2301EA